MFDIFTFVCYYKISFKRIGVDFMSDYQKQFSLFLEAEARKGAVEYALELLKNGDLGVVDLYIDVLTPSLNAMHCELANKKICIWKEHIQTAIVRTVVECCYPFILKELDSTKPSNKGLVVVLCPPEEYHDLGARMAADFFTLCGYQTTFVGSNTPYNDFYNAVETIKPKFIVVSVSNKYNLVVTKKIITDLKNKIGKDLKIIVGGQAFLENRENIKIVGANYFVNTFEDIKALSNAEVLL